LGVAFVAGKASDDGTNGIGFPSADFDAAAGVVLVGVLLPLTLFKNPFILILFVLKKKIELTYIKLIYYFLINDVQ